MKSKTTTIVVPYFTFLRDDNFQEALWSVLKPQLGFFRRLVAVGLAGKWEELNGELPKNRFYNVKIITPGHPFGTALIYIEPLV